MPAIIQEVVRKLHRLHASIQARGRLDTRDAIKAGELLADVKQEQRRGFLVWFKENEEELGFSYATATRYMRLAKSLQSANIQGLADMPLFEAYVVAGIVKEAAAPDDDAASKSRTLGEVLPKFIPAAGLMIERRQQSVPHSFSLTRNNWREELLTLLSDEKAFERVIKQGGLALVFKE